MQNKVSMAFGSFDILHPGHLHYLKSASKYGRLIVIVSRDSSIRRIKGREPVLDELSRLKMVGALSCVDKAVLGSRLENENDIYKIVKRFRPDYIVLGYDQKVDIGGLKRALNAYNLKTKIIRERPFKEQSHKSSKLAAKLHKLR